MWIKILIEAVYIAIGIGLYFLLSALGLDDFVIFMLFVAVYVFFAEYKIAQLENRIEKLES